MKTAKQPATEAASAGSSRRSQPVRQTRTNPSRSNNAALNRTNPLGGGRAHDQPIEIFPAVTHFTDAITALPKELVRHFTLLKEVDAKIFAPEESLFKLIEAALNAPPSDPPRSVNDASSSVAPASAPMSAQNSSSGVVFSGHVPAAASNDEAANQAPFDPSNLPRRQLFRQTAYKIQEMLVSLEEKNHVISTANEALQKQLSRVEDLWPHLEEEFTAEAKWGSTTHWAYLENRIAKANSNSQAERSRRDGAAALSAAAQQLAEEAAARSSDRKQALAAKKNSKNNQSHADDAEGKQQEQPAKKPHGSGKSRKPPASDAAVGVGLGISNSSTNGAQPAPKRRKVESKQSSTSGGAVVEKAMAGVFGSGAVKPKTTSPRETPAPEGAKKRKALPTSSNQSKKSRTNTAMSPSVASSPVVGNFPTDITKVARSSPAPSSNARPSSSRARQNSAQTTTEIVKQIPPPFPSSLPSKPASSAPPATSGDVAAPSNGPQAASEAKIQKDVLAPSEPELIKTESEHQPVASNTPAAPNGGKKEGSGSTTKPAAAAATVITEKSEAKKDTTSINTAAVPPAPTPQPAAQPATTPVTTKSGRASKPSTPSLGTFAEAAAATARSRPARGSETAGSGNNAPKRSHKKGASAAAAAAAAAAIAVTAAGHNRGEPDTPQEEADEEDVDGDEPRYCYCNGISYGEMVACDAEDCKREWFHLACVGLKVAPKANSTWYCDDCKKRLRIGNKAVNGR